MIRSEIKKVLNQRNYIGCSFISRRCGVEESIVNIPRITADQLFKSNLAFCVVCVFTLQMGENKTTVRSYVLCVYFFYFVPLTQSV
jgi:hypothetical protein